MTVHSFFPLFTRSHHLIHSHPQSSRNTFGTPINTDPDNKKAATLFFREIFFNPLMADSVGHIRNFFPINSLRNPTV